jgi:hypothetical protein
VRKKVRALPAVNVLKRGAKGDVHLCDDRMANVQATSKVCGSVVLSTINLCCRRAVGVLRKHCKATREFLAPWGCRDETGDKAVLIHLFNRHGTCAQQIQGLWKQLEVY